MSKRIIFYLLLLLMPFLGRNLIAQENVIIQRSNNKIVLEGKVYYVHVVKKGHTLYSIAKAYNTTEKAIVIENPGSSSALSVGQVLKIPSVSTVSYNVNTGASQDTGKVHVLKAGETIYSVSRMYKCSVEDLLQLNPKLDINDIPVGARIMLPSVDEAENELSFDEEGIIQHEVKRGETLFSLARYYGVTVREIRSLNKHLGWGGPRAGDILKIPQPNTTAEIFEVDTVAVSADSILTDTSGMIQDFEYGEYLQHHIDRSSYKIAYLIPFNYEEMEPLDSLLKDVKSALRRERIKENYYLEAARPKSVNFLEFLEGSLLAVDSLTRQGANFDISVYDTKRSMYETRKILSNPDLKDVDLIIGPFYAFNLELVSEFSMANHIPVVTPFHSDDSLLVKNPYLFQALPSYSTEVDRNAKFIARSYDKNMIFVHDGDSANMDRISYFKDRIFSELEHFAAHESVMFKEVVITGGNTDPLLQSLNPDMENLVILPSVDEAFASQVATRLFYALNDYKIELFGSSYWVGFDDIEISYIHALQLKVSHTLWFDHHNNEHLYFLKKFRDNYYREPSWTTRNGTGYAVSGYDLSLFFLSALQRYGSSFILYMSDYSDDQTLTEYKFKRISQTGGWHNVNMHYYYFDSDLNIVEIPLPYRPAVHHYLRPAGKAEYFNYWDKPDGGDHKRDKTKVITPH